MVFTLEPFAAMMNLAEINAVFQEIGEGTVGEGNAAVEFRDLGVAAVPIVNPIRWRLIGNRAMLPLDVGFVQTDLWGGDRSATVARNARGRDFGAEASNHVMRRANPKRLPFGSIDRLILGGVCRLVPKMYDALAIVRPDTVIRWHRAGFEIATPLRSTARVPGNSPADPRDEPRQPVVGSAQNPW
ncbi:hypothetical protein J6497_31100 [Bradyrhizobium sp. CNPSo 4026]|nr:hypothetical protein [Bradyrhizobium cenepequi]MCA6111587.1 hypothetical protein [Bradyrhizobium cenepequi]